MKSLIRRFLNPMSPRQFDRFMLVYLITLLAVLMGVLYWVHSV